MKDIDDNLTEPLSDMSNTFKGKYDGNGKYVNLAINGASLASVGMFGVCEGAEIKNVTTYGSVTGSNTFDPVGTAKYSSTGAVVGALTSGSSIISNCVNYADVTQTSAYLSGTLGGTGGIVGLSAIPAGGSVIEKCVNNGTVNGATNLGGICGYNNSPIRECINNGNITSNGATVAGIAGAAYGTIEKCANYGNVSSTGDNIGGIAGTLTLTVSECFNMGTIHGRNSIAGIAGRIYAAANASSSISDCFNAGTVSGTNYIGSALGNIGRGKSAAIRNFYDGVNSAMVIVARNSSSSTTLTVSNSYGLAPTAINYPLGGKSKTGEQLKTLLSDDTSFSPEKWTLDEKYEYPQLYSLEPFA